MRRSREKRGRKKGSYLLFLPPPEKRKELCFPFVSAEGKKEKPGEGQVSRSRIVLSSGLLGVGGEKKTERRKRDRCAKGDTDTQRRDLARGNEQASTIGKEKEGEKSPSRRSDEKSDYTIRSAEKILHRCLAKGRRSRRRHGGGKETFLPPSHGAKAGFALFPARGEVRDRLLAAPGAI